MLTAKQECFKNGIISGLAPIDAARAAYPNIKTDSALSTMAHENMMKHAITDAIDEYRAELRAEVGWNVEIAQRKLMAIYKQATALKQPSAAVSAIVATNRMFGLDKDAGVGKAEQPDQLSQADLATLRAMAKAITDKGLKGPQLAQDERKAKQA